MRREDGFTLIELLVVVAIIGLLAAIALPRFVGQGLKAQDAEAKSSLRDGLTQVAACLADHDNPAECPDADTVVPSSVTFVRLGGGPAFELSRRSDSGTIFTLSRDAAGRVTRECDTNRGGCHETSW